MCVFLADLLKQIQPLTHMVLPVWLQDQAFLSPYLPVEEPGLVFCRILPSGFTCMIVFFWFHLAFS